MSCLPAGTLDLDGARVERQTRTRQLLRARSCVRYAGTLALTVPALAIAVVLSTSLGIEVPAVALPTLLTLRLVAAILGTVALTAEARLAHSELAAAPPADASEKLDQVRTTRHGRMAVDGPRESWEA
jgi:hypothetical protein